MKKSGVWRETLFTFSIPCSSKGAYFLFLSWMWLWLRTRFPNEAEERRWSTFLRPFPFHGGMLTCWSAFFLCPILSTYIYSHSVVVPLSRLRFHHHHHHSNSLTDLRHTYLLFHDDIRFLWCELIKKKFHVYTLICWHFIFAIIKIHSQLNHGDRKDK